MSKLGPVTYRVQVEDFIWKRHIDKLKDLSGTKIQPEAGEVTEDLLLQPSQVQPTRASFAKGVFLLTSSSEGLLQITSASKVRADTNKSTTTPVYQYQGLSQG